MNKRIKELAEQATIQEGSHGAFGEPTINEYVDLEKFAQLIVQDCVMFIDKGAEKFSDGEWLRTSVKDIGAMIEEHFGVE